jgi:hypothetical protein
MCVLNVERDEPEDPQWWQTARAALLFGLAGVGASYMIPAISVQAVDAITRERFSGIVTGMVATLAGFVAIVAGLGLNLSAAYFLYGFLRRIQNSTVRVAVVGVLTWILVGIPEAPWGGPGHGVAAVPGFVVGIAVSRFRWLDPSPRVDRAGIAFFALGPVNLALAANAFFFRVGDVGWLLAFVVVPFVEVSSALLIGLRKPVLLTIAVGALLAAPVARIGLPFVVGVPEYQEFAGTFPLGRPQPLRHETRYSLDVDILDKVNSTKAALFAISRETRIFRRDRYQTYRAPASITRVRVAVYEIDKTSNRAHMLASLTPTTLVDSSGSQFGVMYARWEGDELLFETKAALDTSNRSQGAYCILASGQLNRVDSIPRDVPNDAKNRQSKRRLEGPWDRIWLAHYGVDPVTLLPEP